MKVLKLFLPILVALNMFFLIPKNSSDPVENVQAQAVYKIRPIYLYPSDFPFKQKNLDALKEGMAQIQSWYMKSTGGYTFEYFEPIAIKANHDLAYFKCLDGGCDGGVSYEESVNWGRVYYELGDHGYWSCAGGTINLVVMDGAGGFAGGGWCGSKNSGGQALVGTWTFESHYGDYRCKDIFQCGTGPSWGAAAHELGHAFGLPHTFDFDPNCESVMGQHWNYPKVELCSSPQANEVAFLKSLNYFSDKRTSADNTDPQVTLTSPTSGSTVSGYIPLLATATDNEKLQRIDYYVDGELFAMNVQSFGNHIYPTLAKLNGTHQFYAKAYDFAGNSATTPTTNVTFNNSNLSDSSPPSASFSSPIDNGSVRGFTDLVASVTDNVGVENVYFGHHWQIFDQKNIAGGQLPKTGFNFGSQYLGKHTLNIRVTDKAGNITPFINIHVINFQAKIGDVNGDGRVDILDLSYLLSSWTTNDPKADINSDGTIDILDLSTLLSEYGT